MSAENEYASQQPTPAAAAAPVAESQKRHELDHLRGSTRWFMLLGVVLILGGLIAIVFPAITSWAAVSVLGIILLITGIATIVGAFWAGRWSGFLIQLLVGILYLACGMIVTDRPEITVAMITLFMAVFFVMLGVFRSLAALILRFSQWGWALLNGVITLVCGLVIYRNWPYDALWAVGLLIGLELLFNGWMWVMFSLALRHSPLAQRLEETLTKPGA